MCVARLCYLRHYLRCDAVAYYNVCVIFVWLGLLVTKSSIKAEA